MTEDYPSHNPYDFANPITNMSLLADRAKERSEIDYYLQHAATAPRPINIALLGNRAAGKTSLLNYTEDSAQKIDCFAARINLDSAIASTQMSFFHHILDTLIQKACHDGIFNGIHGRVFDAYLDLVTKYEIPDTKEFCFFFFPVRYAKAMQAGSISADVPSNTIQHDLEIIRSEIKRPIVLIFDECNTLIQNSELLQKYGIFL